MKMTRRCPTCSREWTPHQTSAGGGRLGRDRSGDDSESQAEDAAVHPILDGEDSRFYRSSSICDARTGHSETNTFRSWNDSVIALARPCATFSDP